MLDPPFDFAQTDYSLASASLYDVGGEARLALLPNSREEAVGAYAWACRQGMPLLVLGGGSNVLISDDGFPGIVLLTTGLDEIVELGTDRFRIEGGVELDEIVTTVLVRNNYEGTGGLTGIPGTVGGAIYMNAGTLNGSICQLMESVEILDAHGAREVAMEPSLYSYRGQRFCPPAGLIVQATFSFRRAQEDQQAIYDHYIKRRVRTQPQGKSCGSVFKNPPDDHAGRLIEACGLKGTRHGGATISEVHANFIINEGGATCSDVLSLIELCKEKVRHSFGVTLEEEVKVIGIER